MRATLKELTKVINPTNDWQQWADVEVTGVEFDSRKISKGNIYVPLEGQRDGHEFVENAKNNGASLALWSRPVEEAPGDFPVLVVANPLLAMQQLSKYFLNKINPKVIAVTGSNGKTTTKDMIAAVLSQEFVTYKTQGNYNNHIGLPYTILHMPETTEMLVLEMGMNHFDEIDFLSQLAEPDIAAITMIGESHIEFLGSREGIAKAKMEICSGLKPNGLLIIPSAENLLTHLVQEDKYQVLRFGSGANSEVSAQISNQAKESTVFTSNLTREQELTVPVVGSYNVQNALIAVAVGHYFKISNEKIAYGLQTMNITQSRTEWLKAWNGAEVLSDVYNANPTAMAMVLDTFSQLEVNEEGRRLVVLADMGELGEESQRMHEEMAQHIRQDKIQEVFLFGSVMYHLYSRLIKVFPKERVHHFSVEEKPELMRSIKEKLQPKDMIMLKGSNSMKLIEIIEKIVEN